MSDMEPKHSNLLQNTLSSISDKFQVQAIDLPDQPIFLAVAAPLSDGITGLKPRLPAGRGFTKSQAAMSAAAEAVELLSCLATNEMSRSRISASRDGQDQDIVFGTDMATGAVSEVSAQAVYLDYAAVFGEALTLDADTTGCASDAALSQAKLRGLLECIERDALAIWWYGRQSRPHISLDFFDIVHPRLAFWLSERNRRTIAIDITSDVGVPVIVAASSEPDGSLVAMGSAANPDWKLAVIAATTEMIQIEASMELTGQYQNLELEQWFAKASLSKMPQFRPNQTARIMSPVNEVNILSCVGNAGFSALAVDLTLAAYPLASARVIVPNFCSMNRRLNVERILAHSALFPSAEAAQAPDEFELFDPY
jgi:thiazole/oxazole-forming peptide maturase SagD family component